MLVYIVILTVTPNSLTMTGWTLTNTIVFMNSSINPFLYCWRTRDNRTIVSKMLGDILFKQTAES